MNKAIVLLIKPIKSPAASTNPEYALPILIDCCDIIIAQAARISGGRFGNG